MSKMKVCRKCGYVMGSAKDCTQCGASSKGKTGRKIGSIVTAMILISAIAGCSSSGSTAATEETTSTTVSTASAVEESSTIEENISENEASSETEETKSTVSEEESKAENTAESKSESEEEVKEEASGNVYKVGETLDTGKMKVTFQSVEDYVSDNMFIEPEEGNKYIRAYFVMENTGSSDTLVSSYDFDCYADDSAADIPLLSDKMLSSATLSPGRKAEGYVYFEVPQNAQKIEIEYETSYWTQKKAIFVVK